MCIEDANHQPALKAALTKIDRLRKALDAALQIKAGREAERLLSNIIETASVIDQMKTKDDQS